MHSLLCERVLLPQGWAEAVTIAIDDSGDIVGVDVGAIDPEAVKVAGCVMPGVPNLHSHAHQRAMAGLGERSEVGEDSFWSWREVMYRHLERLRPEQLEAIAAQLYLEMVKSGYTSVAEFQYLHHDASGVAYENPAEMSLRIAAAARAVGIGVTLLPVLYRFGGFGGKPPVDGQRRFLNDPEPYLRIFEALRAACAHDPNTVTGLAPHSLRAITEDLLADVLAGAEKDIPIHIHIAEQMREVQECLQWSGQRPVQWLFDRIDVDSRWCLVHATHINAAEIERLASSGAVAGLCPSTEANLGDGLFQAVPYLSGQGRFGIGSDSNISVSPVEELRWLEYGQRLARKQRCVFADGATRSTARRLLDRILAGGARACGRRIGRVKPGYRADFLVLDTDHPLLYGRRGDDLLDSWVFAGNANVVRDVFVGGVRVVAGGMHAEEERIGARFRQVMNELLG